MIEKEYLERLSETYLLNRYPTIVFTKAIQRLISAAEDFDYLFLAEVVKRMKEFAEIKPEQTLGAQHSGELVALLAL